MRNNSPEEPCSAVRVRPVLTPCAEVVAASDALPTGPHDREVVLAAKELLWLATETISEIRFVDMTIVESQALPVESNRPAMESDMQLYVHEVMLT